MGMILQMNSSKTLIVWIHLYPLTLVVAADSLSTGWDIAGSHLLEHF